MVYLHKLSRLFTAYIVKMQEEKTVEERTIAHSRAVWFKPAYFLAVIVILCFFIGIHHSKLMFYKELENYISTPMKWELIVESEFARSMAKTGWEVARDVAEAQMKPVADVCRILCWVLLVCYLYGLPASVTVTDRRVCGRDGFGMKIDLPLDAISAVRCSGRRGIILTTARGTVRLPCMKRPKEVYDAILLHLR